MEKMREIKIQKPVHMHDDDRHFRNSNTEVIIKCDQNLAKRCTPDCAACDVPLEVDGEKVICLRGSFQIGEIE